MELPLRFQDSEASGETQLGLFDSLKNLVSPAATQAHARSVSPSISSPKLPSNNHNTSHTKTKIAPLLLRNNSTPTIFSSTAHQSPTSRFRSHGTSDESPKSQRSHSSDVSPHLPSNRSSSRDSPTASALPPSHRSHGLPHSRVRERRDSDKHSQPETLHRQTSSNLSSRASAHSIIDGERDMDPSPPPTQPQPHLVRCHSHSHGGKMLSSSSFSTSLLTSFARAASAAANGDAELYHGGDPAAAAAVSLSSDNAPQMRRGEEAAAGAETPVPAAVSLSHNNSHSSPLHSHSHSAPKSRLGSGGAAGVLPATTTKYDFERRSTHSGFHSTQHFQLQKLQSQHHTQAQHTQVACSPSDCACGVASSNANESATSNNGTTASSSSIATCTDSQSTSYAASSSSSSSPISKVPSLDLLRPFSPSSSSKPPTQSRPEYRLYMTPRTRYDAITHSIQSKCALPPVTNRSSASSSDGGGGGGGGGAEDNAHMSEKQRRLRSPDHRLHAVYDDDEEEDEDEDDSREEKKGPSSAKKKKKAAAAAAAAAQVLRSKSRSLAKSLALTKRHSASMSALSHQENKRKAALQRALAESPYPSFPTRDPIVINRNANARVTAPIDTRRFRSPHINNGSSTGALLGGRLGGFFGGNAFAHSAAVLPTWSCMVRRGSVTSVSDPLGSPEPSYSMVEDQNGAFDVIETDVIWSLGRVKEMLEKESSVHHEEIKQYLNLIRSILGE